MNPLDHPFPDLSESGGLAHATTVAFGRRALMIAGPSGCGKSALALRIMAFGGLLVSDDRTCLTLVPGGPPLASAPETLRGRIEARGIGLLGAEAAPPTPVAAILRLDISEEHRLPPLRRIKLAGFDVDLLHSVESPHFASALLQYLKGGRSAP